MHEHDQLTNLPVVIEHAGDHVVVERRNGRAGLRLGELRRRRLPLREHDVHLHAARDNRSDSDQIRTYILMAG